MGFYLRKGFQFGPFRLNLSKSGLGVSFGVKGARISTGPRGAYINMGRHGVYYRKRLDGKTPVPHRRQNHVSPAPTPVVNSDAYAIKTVDVTKLVDASSEEVLAQINGNLRLPAHAPKVRYVAAFLSAAMLLASRPFMVALAVFIAGLALARFVRKYDVQRRTSHLCYELDEHARQRFAEITSALRLLSQAEHLWCVIVAQPVIDRKDSAGAASLITRQTVALKTAAPPNILTNVETWCLDLCDMQLYFFPDRILVWQNGQYGAIAYEQLSITCGDARFIEEDKPPSDAKTVGQTWKHPNKNGGPDRRYKQNYQIPVMLYGQLNFATAAGFHVLIQVSDREKAEQFARRFGKIK